MALQSLARFTPLAPTRTNLPGLIFRNSTASMACSPWTFTRELYSPASCRSSGTRSPRPGAFVKRNAAMQAWSSHWHVHANLSVQNAKGNERKTVSRRHGRIAARPLIGARASPQTRWAATWCRQSDGLSGTTIVCPVNVLAFSHHSVGRDHGNGCVCERLRPALRSCGRVSSTTAFRNASKNAFTVT